MYYFFKISPFAEKIIGLWIIWVCLLFVVLHLMMRYVCIVWVCPRLYLLCPVSVEVLLKKGVFWGIFWKLVLVEDVVMNEFFRPFFSDVAWCSFFCCHFSVFLYKITINTSVNFVFLQPRAFKNQLSALVFLFLWRIVLLIYVVVYTNLFDVVSSFLNQIFFFKIIA